MGALPKRKYAKSRQGKRRSHLHLIAPNLVPCPRCRSLRLAHRVCPVCGTYAGRQEIKLKGPKQREK